MLNTAKAFLGDRDASEMYVTGRAGTGKTTELAKVVEHCHTEEIQIIVCAFTHDACNILRAKLPEGTIVMTLHAFLKKRPSINTDANKLKHVEVNRKMGDTLKTTVVAIDEYSQVGERDLMDLRDEENLRIIWLGDPYQLPPVGDMQSVTPQGKYQVMLRTQYRRGKGNPLDLPIDQLVSFIEGAKPEPLIESEKFIRGKDIKSWYQDSIADTKILLAFTNQRVQELNAAIQGYKHPQVDDIIFCPSNKQTYRFANTAYPVTEISLPYGSEILALGSKYKTLEYLLDQEYGFCDVINEEGETETLCYVFGYANYNNAKKKLKHAAAESNRAIGKDAVKWSRANPTAPKAKARAAAWRAFLSFNQCVVCLDFPHAKTVHKSQGSTYQDVYLDTKDLGIAAEIDYLLYLRLMYVALSRASDTVVTN